jgi:multidrug transporter EmrE-like cation transporter
MTSIAQDSDKKRKFMAISTQGIILIIVAATMMSFGSLGLKGAIEAIGGFGENIATIYKDVFALMVNPIFIVGLILYGGGTLIWMRVLSTEPISVGYPILMSIAFITVTGGAAFFFSEAITVPKLIGMGIIVVGVIIATNG